MLSTQKLFRLFSAVAVDVVLFFSLRCLLQYRVRPDVTVSRRICRNKQPGEQSDQVQPTNGSPQNGEYLALVLTLSSWFKVGRNEFSTWQLSLPA